MAAEIFKPRMELAILWPESGNINISLNFGPEMDTSELYQCYLMHSKSLGNHLVKLIFNLK